MFFEVILWKFLGNSSWATSTICYIIVVTFCRSGKLLITNFKSLQGASSGGDFTVPPHANIMELRSYIWRLWRDLNSIRDRLLNPVINRGEHYTQKGWWKQIHCNHTRTKGMRKFIRCCIHDGPIWFTLDLRRIKELG